jgi:hypothetical protein
LQVCPKAVPRPAQERQDGFHFFASAVVKVLPQDCFPFFAFVVEQA